LGALTAVGQRQPADELRGGFFGCLPVERHHRRWHTREPTQLGAPARVHGHDLDVVRPSGYRFFEVMHVTDAEGFRLKALILRGRHT
jgi:hypothetical protein